MKNKTKESNRNGKTLNESTIENDAEQTVVERIYVSTDELSKYKKHNNFEELKQKSPLELIKLLENTPYKPSTQGKTFGGQAIVPIIENVIEQAIVEHISKISANDLLRYQFVKLKRIYNSGYFDSDKERGENTKKIRINALTGYNAEKTNAINAIIANINKDLYEILLKTKHDNAFIDLIHYNCHSYWDSNDTEFVYGKTSFLYEKDPQKPIKTKEEYQKAIERKVFIQKRQFKTKLHNTIAEIIHNYEQNDKSVFDNFDEIHEFIKRYIDEKIPQKFTKMKTGTFNQELANLKTRSGEENDFGINIYRNPNFTLKVPMILGGKFYPTTQRLINALLSVNTTHGGESPIFSFSISNYMKMCGLKNRKETLKQMKRDLNIATQSQYEWKEHGRCGQMNIIDKWDTVKDDVQIRLTQSFWDIFKKYPVGSLSLESFRINIQKHPNSHHFSFKITQHKHMNYSKPTADIIAVKTLLEGSEIPPYEEVIAKYSGSIHQKIIDPFERDLDALDKDFTWEYCGKNGALLTDEELNNFTYDIFIKSNIKATWKHFPDQTKRLEKRQNYIELSKHKQKNLLKK